MIEDLKLAESYAPEEWPTEQYTRGRITKNGVRALLADVYLWKASDVGNADARADYIIRSFIQEIPPRAFSN